MSIINRFQLGLKKTSSLISKNILNALSSNKIDDDTIEEIESVLLTSDIGIEVTDILIKKIKSIKFSDKIDINSILNILGKELETILKPREENLLSKSENKPNIILFVGVNGSGKTTTIGKFIRKISKNKKILIVACDTFRAAAVEQLKEWSSQEGVDFYNGSLNQDPASLAFSACIKGKKENYDYVIIDTAGRLSNNTNLLNQLVKIKTVVKKTSKENSIETILVLDGTNGSNMINQVEIFGKTMDVTGLIITKIDGTAKGGAIISIAKNYEIPIYFVGLGEKVEDLLNFNAKEFARSMLEIGE